MRTRQQQSTCESSLIMLCTCLFLLLVGCVWYTTYPSYSPGTNRTDRVRPSHPAPPSPITPPTPKGIPNLHGCLLPQARTLPYCNTSLSLDERVDDLVSRFASLQELLEQITPQTGLVFGNDPCPTITRGNQRLGIPPWMWLVETNTQVSSVCLTQGHCVTTFPGPLGMAASFNRTNWRLKGIVMGTEMRSLNNLHGHRHGVYAPIGLTGFGPNINLARDPRFGRISELPGEDPYLSGTYAYEMVSGMQNNNDDNDDDDNNNGIMRMAAFLKHFTAYSREQDRGHDTYNISQFDFWDSYLPQYELAFQANPAGVMCSYNAENGVPSCANDWLLNKVLRQEWNQPHALVTADCGAVSNLLNFPVHATSKVQAAAYALMNGTDIEMGSQLFQQYLPAAVEQGLATQDRIIEAVKRTFRLHFQLGRFDPITNDNSNNKRKELYRLGLSDINSTHHQHINYHAALQSFVLLKNDHRALPLTPGSTIAVVGPQAVTKAGLFSDYAGDEICFNNSLDCMPTIAQAIAMVNRGGTTLVAQGVDMNSTRTDGIDEALTLSTSADAVVVVVGNDRSIECEGKDRVDTALVGMQEEFVRRLLGLNRPTILVLTNGGPLAIDSLIKAPHDNQPYAIVEAFNPSTMGPNALAATLFGLENKWGKLPLTMYPHSYIQEQAMANFDMSAYPGRTYKYYQGQPLFGFGHGLSLTDFHLHCALRMSRSIAVECAVQNTGQRVGDEVLMLYHRIVDIGPVSHALPERALRDFVRLSDIAPGESVTTTFATTKRTFQVVNEHGKRTLYPGKHELVISRSPMLQEQVLTVNIKKESGMYRWSTALSR